MNSTLAKLKSHFTNWREWELNPIVIKELRQAVRSWAVTGMLLLFLTVLFITSLVLLVNQSFQVEANQQLGAQIFSTFVVILTGASVLFIPLYIGIRLAAERVDSNPDLLYISTLSPGRIIRGKVFCGAYMTVLFFSACMPFMAFTNLLRGVDLPSVFFILTFVFLVVCAMNQVAIFLACLPISRPFKILIGLVGVLMSFWIIVPVIMSSLMMMQAGVGAMMAGRDFWIGIVTMLGMGLAVMGLLYFLSVGLISPLSANRALPVRVYITIIWVVGGLVSLGWVWREKNATLMLPWTFVTFYLMILSLIVVISNNDRLSLRVQRDIPKGKGKRFFAFLFFNGAAGGLIWVAAISVATYFATTGLIFFGESWFSGATAISDLTSSGLFTIYSTTMAYAFAYALTALFIQRRFLSKRPSKITGVLAIILAALAAILPSVVLFFLNKLSWRTVEGLQLGNAFNVPMARDEGSRGMHMAFAFAWVAGMFVLNMNWFVRQVKNFKPYDPTQTPPVINDAPPAT